MVKPPSRPRRWRWRILLLIVLAGCGYLAWFSYLRVTRRPTPRVAYWEARLAELDPPGPNALSSQEATALLTTRPWETGPVVVGPSGRRYFTRVRDTAGPLLFGPWDKSRDEISAAIRACESPSFKQARNQMQEAVQRGWPGSSPLDVSAINATEAINYHVWGNWLLIHARWARESRDDLSTAIEDYVTALGLARQLQRFWPEYARMTAMELAARVADEMMLAAKDARQPVQVAELTKRIDAIFDPSPDPGKLVEPDRIALHCFLELWYVREGGDWMDVSELATVWAPWQGFGFLGRGAFSKPSRYWNLLSPVYHDLPTARQAIEDNFAAAKTCTDLRALARGFQNVPYGARLAAADGFIGWTPGFGLHVLTGYYWMRMRLDAALAMLAIQEYKRQHGQYPRRLDDLVPAFLTRLPIDYVDRQPLRYRVTDTDYCLYCVGADGDDDGGRGDIFWDYWRFYETRDGDLVFNRIERRSRE